MHASNLFASGRERPMGDRDDRRKQWSPEQVERVSNDEVKNPEGDDIDDEVDIDESDDPSKD